MKIILNVNDGSPRFKYGKIFKNLKELKDEERILILNYIKIISKKKI